jgi:SET domain-containing protein
MAGEITKSAPPVGLVTWRAIPGKRRGVVAVRDCAAGTELERSLVIYNHSSNPNVELEDGPDPDTMSVIALRDIKAGEELTYDYDTDLWFEPHREH